MLCVRIDGREVETTPVALARMVLDGEVDRTTPSKTSSGASEESLEQSLRSSHGEVLTGELLERIRAMYSPRSSVDVQELRIRVEDLCQWRWASAYIAARLFWAAAWLNELAGRFENATAFYDAFLQTPSRESHLRLLAYNNRGVLRIRLGRLEGVQDLARAAVLSDPHVTEPVPSAGLPAACFNLLNLINVVLTSDSLTQAVDEELADFFSQFSAEVRTMWLGPESTEDRREPGGGWLGRSGSADTILLILRDPTYRRLNRVTTHLADRARRLTACESQQTAKQLSSAGCQLRLWGFQHNGKDSGTDRDDEKADRGVFREYDRDAEAASLLLSDDVPACLVRLESPLSQAERFAQEELADIESHLALNHYELAKSRLRVQQRILSSLNRRGRFAGLLSHMDAQLARIAQLEAQSEQFDFQRACARLVSIVGEFCRITDPCQAERELPDLGRRLQEFRTRATPPAGDEMAALLDELTARVERHMHRLKRLEIRRRIRGPLRHLRQNWPAGWTAPVAESVYLALARCHLNDPESWIEDWAALQDRLDAHQGRFHLQEALAALQAECIAWDRVEDDLAGALALKPDLWLTVAPLFGLSCPPSSNEPREMTTEAQIAVRAAADRLLETVPQRTDDPNGDMDRSPMRRARRLLSRAFQQASADTRRVVRLWECVEATLLSALATGHVDAIVEVEALAETCLDHWPTGQTQVPGRADPRNPISLFLESCAKARRLAEAERFLNARPPQLEEARRCYREVLRAGLDTGDQLGRVATGLYLSAFRQQDSPQMQRQVLPCLEEWVETVPEEAKRRIREQDVIGEIERMRVALSAERPVSAAGLAWPGGSAADQVGYAAAGGLGDTGGESKGDHINPEKVHEQPDR